MELMQANRQWSSRPADERFLSLDAMQSHFDNIIAHSKAVVVSSRKLDVVPSADNKGMEVFGPNGHGYAPTHFSFGQLAARVGAPAGYLRTLPSPMAADCLNYGFKVIRDIEDIGILLYKNGSNMLRAATGPKYGRIWNADIVRGLRERFGDGRTGNFRVPGEFGRDVAITNQNTTLYAGDRDMFVFLADETNRIEIGNRRNGQPGSLARGFFVWNSEVGSSTFGIGTFLFDYVCSNRIVWGASEYKEITLRHTASAPDRFIEEVTPALQAYAQSSGTNIVKAIEDARAARLDNVNEFLAKRFGKRMVSSLMAVHQAEEERPIETLWDVTTAVTAYARNVKWQDERVTLERQAGDIMALAA